jgi:hypothetical protein
MVIGAVSLLIAAGYLWQALLMPQGSPGQPGPGLWPSAVGVAWVVISILVIAEAAISVQVGGEVDFPSGVERRNVILFYVFTVAFVVLIPIIGMYLASIAYVIALLKLTSDLSWWKVGLYGAAIGFLIPLFFISVLQLRMPLGFFEYLF